MRPRQAPERSSNRDPPMTIAAVAAQRLTDALRLASRRGAGARCVLVIDPFVLAPKLLRSVEQRRLVRVPFHNRPELRADQRLCLIDLREADDPFLEESTRQASTEIELEHDQQPTGRSIGGWLQTDSSAPQVAAHLELAINQRGMDRQLRYVRLGDPRVLLPLWSAMSAQDQRRLLGPIGVWHAVDRLGNLCSLSSQAPLDNSAWRATPSQWAILGRLFIANQALSQWHVEPERASLPGDTHALADALICHATRLGITHTDDQIAFCLAGLRHGETFFDHPRVSALLPSVVQGKRPFDDVLAEAISAEGWAQIEREHPRRPANSTFTPRAAP